MTISLIPNLIAALLLTTGLIFALRGPARRLNLVDHPGGRKRHAAPTPLVGGIAVFGGFLLAVLTVDMALRPYAALFAGMGLLLACGVVDDLRDMRSTTKLAVQIIAATLVVAWGGMVLTEVGDFAPAGTLSLGAWAMPLTLFGIVGLVNAVNMLDGLDGLAGGASFVMLLWLAVAAHLNGLADAPAIIAVLAAALAGFLFFNARHPLRGKAAVFLGDAGSMLLGLAIAWFSVEVARAGVGAPVSPVAVGWIIALPVMDTVSLMLRRLVKGRSPFVADREHLHHLFMRAGYSPGQASWMLVAIAFSFGGVGVMLSVYGVPDLVLASGLAVAIGLHFVFIRYAWRTMKALRRLGQRRSSAPEAASTPLQPGHTLASPVTGWRRGLALAGLYMMVAAIPLSTALTNIGLGLVLAATIASAPAFLRDMVRLPVFWLAVILTVYVGLVSLVGEIRFPALAEESVPHWRHLLRVTVLLSLPLAWWLAGARFHWPWLFWALIAASAAAFAVDAHWPELMRGELGDSTHYGSPDDYASTAACVLVLLFAIAVAAIARFGRGWRPAFTLIISLAAAVPVLLLLVVSNYTTAWIGAGVGILIVGVSAILYGANRQQWAGLIGGALLVAVLGAGSWFLIHESVPTRDAFQEPLQAAALYVGGEHELARERHPATATRLTLWGEALRSAGGRPFTGWGVTSPRRDLSLEDIGRQGTFQNFYLSLLVGYGLLGLGLFIVLAYVLIRRVVRATQRKLLPVGIAVALYGVMGTMATMLLLSTQINHTASRTLIILLFAFLGAVGVMRRWERDRLSVCRARMTVVDEAPPALIRGGSPAVASRSDDVSREDRVVGE
ncbi:MraY family glycosyltransferase [Aquisalimonas lutea]|uniref:MraY family glycosyltransferase n=1 Tax=Aquisalimonas lutea TaxID=1327750 RepID=UPI0025B29443|nr:MraY family glycosyltransferase [Aquisalimonas lutea]MDN3517832.1 MraY family glycosyltransferase [Aquisalimonas lutea]